MMPCRSCTVRARPSSDALKAPASSATWDCSLALKAESSPSTASRAVLERVGHVVSEAFDGASGIARILADKPDVAIVDISLPGMDGYDVAKAVRAALGKQVYLVAMTAHDRDIDRARSMAAGFDKHMTKPVDIELVKAMLDAS